MPGPQPSAQCAMSVGKRPPVSCAPRRRAALPWGLLVAAALLWGGPALPGRTDEPKAPDERTLTGEVVAVWCYLAEGSWGTGPANAEGARRCIRLGSPIALRTREREWYLLSLPADRPSLKAKLMSLAGHQVTVTGQVLEGASHPTMVLSNVKRTTTSATQGGPR